MESAVFVWPMQILAALYGDMVVGQPRGRGFLVEHRKVGETGEKGDKLTIRFNCRTLLVPGGRIHLEVSVERKVGGCEAEPTAVVAMVEALRTQFSIFPADYSYGVIAEKKNALFNAMGEALQGFMKTYFEMDEAVDGYHKALLKLSTAVSTWLTSGHAGARVNTMAAVGAMHVWVTECAATLNKDRTETTKLVAMVVAREEPPEALVRLNRIAPMPIVT